MCGYVEQARARLQAAIRLTEDLSIPLSQADAYFNNALVYQLLGEPDEVRRWADAAVELARSRGYRYCHAIACVRAGWARAVQGDFEAGLSQLREGMTAWIAEGVRYSQTYNYALLAEAYLAAGRLDSALSTLLEGQAFANEVGDHFYEPELYRLHGRLLERQRATPQQVADQYGRALSLARQQGAKSLELRAALGLARTWATQNKRKAAYDLLAETYGWFTEGFDTPDLQAAQALLATLTA